MNPADNLALIGPMGAGKSSIGKRLAERLGWAFADSDREIEARTGASVATIFECEGEAGFRRREHVVLMDLLAHTGQVIATGGGIVSDPDNRRLLRERSYVVYLRADTARQAERLARDRSRPLLTGHDRVAVLQHLAVAREPWYCEIADLDFETSRLTPNDAALQLYPLLQSSWQRGRLEPVTTDSVALPSPRRP